MKSVLPVLFLALLIAGCSQPAEETVDTSQTKVGYDGSTYIMQLDGSSNEPFTGSVIEKYDNGQLTGKTAYKAGKPEGSSELYYENGQLKFKGTFRDGKQVGRYSHYYENGQLRFKGIYKDGKHEGSTESYYENGQLAQKGIWKDGKLIITNQYNEDGVLIESK